MSVDVYVAVQAYPVCEYAFALLYFTGSDHFNRSMRWYAKKLGLSLSDHGLYKAVRVNKEKLWVSWNESQQRNALSPLGIFLAFFLCFACRRVLLKSVTRKKTFFANLV